MAVGRVQTILSVKNEFGGSYFSVPLSILSAFAFLIFFLQLNCIASIANILLAMLAMAV